jgi:hypothetical protein
MAFGDFELRSVTGWRGMEESQGKLAAWGGRKG